MRWASRHTVHDFWHHLIDLQAEGHPLAAGHAGENFTISGIDWPTLRAGAVLDIGDVRCQLSAPAIPCAKNDQWFTTGHVAPGDPATMGG